MLFFVVVSSVKFSERKCIRKRIIGVEKYSVIMFVRTVFTWNYGKKMTLFVHTLA
jgi:hypothetical protein